VRTYRLSRRASKSLIDIAHYIGREAADPERGLAFVSKLRAQCEKLAELPGEIGRPRRDLGPDMRSFVYGRYAIAFRYAGDTIDILDIVHVRRDRARGSND
jgi:toxin ParE1/3/4